MKELDFDELDRAVSSLMGGAGSNDAAKPAATPGPVSGSTPNLAQPVEVSRSSSVTLHSSERLSASPAQRPTVSAPSTPPAAKRVGRFMDVVHPSSDMKTESMGSVPQTIIAPQPEPVVEMPIETTSPVDLGEGPKSEWGDPIDFHMQQLAQTQKDQAIDEQEATDSVDLANTVEQTEDTDTVETTEPSLDLIEDEPSVAPNSPFLSDAKVEKRPLGGFASDLGQPSTPGSEPKDDDNQVAPQPPVELPEELSHDIVSIEAGITGPSSDVADVTSNAIVEQAKADGIVVAEPKLEKPRKEKKSRKDKKNKLVAETPVDTVAPIGAGSINQQYKEEKSSAPEDHAAVYDSASTTPLKHPEKKHSAVFVVMVILLLLILGAGGGAAVYFFFL